MVLGDVLRRLLDHVSHARQGRIQRLSTTTVGNDRPTNVLGVRSCVSPVQSLSLFCYLQLLALLFYEFVSLAVLGYDSYNMSMVNIIEARFLLT